MFGGCDLIRPQVEQDIEVDWICVTDDVRLEVPIPYRRVVVEEAADSDAWVATNLAAKRFKLMPWTIADRHRAIWIDANMEVTAPSFVREALSCIHDGIAVFRHPRRSCIYEEAEASLGVESQGGKYSGMPIRRQVDHYRLGGHPDQGGLWACGVIAWDLANPQTRELGKQWMEEIERWTVQDQLSLPVVLRRLGLKPGEFPGELLEEEHTTPHYLGNRWLRIWPHQSSETKGRRERLAAGPYARLRTMTGASAEQGSSTPRYDFEEIDLESSSVHADVVKLVGEGKRVLELGPATGYMSRVFTDRGCTVVGIEFDPEMARHAKDHCERVIVGDLDTFDPDAELGEERFDAIVAADVLEHLKDPLAALARLRPFLQPDGYFVISVPNVAHGSVRLALLSGHFDYREAGLLDSTHLRFFTRESLEQLLDEAELGLAELHRHELNIDASEVSVEPEAVPSAVWEELERDPDARTYQFVVKAVPMEREGLREIQARLRELVELRLAASRTAELEQKMSEIAGREGELRHALIEAHDQVLRRDAQIEDLNQGLARRDEEIRSVHAQLHQVQLEIQAMQNGTYGRAYRLLRRLPGVGWLRRHRK